MTTVSANWQRAKNQQIVTVKRRAVSLPDCSHNGSYLFTFRSYIYTWNSKSCIQLWGIFGEHIVAFLVHHTSVNFIAISDSDLHITKFWKSRLRKVRRKFLLTNKIKATVFLMLYSYHLLCRKIQRDTYIVLNWAINKNKVWRHSTEPSSTLRNEFKL